jgi:hypothetical protein
VPCTGFLSFRTGHSWSMTDSLAIYLNDHLLGATGGLELFKRAAASIPAVAALVPEIEEDRQVLLRIIELVGAKPDHAKVLAGWVGEKVGRLKLNGYLFGRAPLSDLIELEGLTLGVHGKLAAWRLLHSLHDPRLEEVDFAQLILRAERQEAALEALRLARGTTVLAA